jgi:Arc/MetJ-type ribon-helix-helix transcriptional regulator
VQAAITAAIQNKIKVEGQYAVTMKSYDYLVVDAASAEAVRLALSADRQKIEVIEERIAQMQYQKHEIVKQSKNVPSPAAAQTAGTAPLPANSHFAEDTTFASTIPHQFCNTINIATCSKIPLCTLAPDGMSCAPFTWDPSTTVADVQAAITAAIQDKIAIEGQIAATMKNFSDVVDAASAEAVRLALRADRQKIEVIEDHLAQFRYQERKIIETAVQTATAAAASTSGGSASTSPSSSSATAAAVNPSSMAASTLPFSQHASTTGASSSGWVGPVVGVMGTAGLVGVGFALYTKPVWLTKLHGAGEATVARPGETENGLYGGSSYSAI